LARPVLSFMWPDSKSMKRLVLDPCLSALACVIFDFITKVG